jgi:predicted amidohydrolase YtcJ
MKPHLINLIVHNARIYDPLLGFLPQSALAVSGSRIVLLGADKDILPLKNGHTLIFNARGNILMPAFMDCHTHFMGYVRRQQEVDVEHCRSLGETLDVIKRKVEETPEGEWITGGGWNRNIWKSGEYPHRTYLDRISTHHFIALDSKDWHSCWVNTAVLEMCGISQDAPVASGANRGEDDQTGVLEEDARLVVYDAMPKWDYNRLRNSYLKTVQEFHRCGITTIHTVETPAEFRLFEEARRQGELGLRTFWYLPHKFTEIAGELSVQQGLGDEWLQISGIKMFVDGSFGSQTAELLENYDHLDHAGVENMNEDQLQEAVGRAVKSTLSCAIHAIGDRAVRKALQVLGQFAGESKHRGLRHRIEHAQLIRPEDLPLFEKYNVYASVQPIHLANDIPVINKYLESRAPLTYPLGSLKKQGARLIFGSDIPVEHFHPWKAIYTALERKFNFDPSQPSFFPEQAVDLQTCLAAYTVNGAASVGMDQSLDRIREGMLADFILLDRDIFAVAAPALMDTQLLLTVADGKVVYENLGDV